MFTAQSAAQLTKRSENGGQEQLEDLVSVCIYMTGRKSNDKQAPFCSFPRPFCRRLVDDWQFRRISASKPQPQ